jgi:hypothetical protein
MKIFPNKSERIVQPHDNKHNKTANYCINNQHKYFGYEMKDHLKFSKVKLLWESLIYMNELLELLGSKEI